MIRSLLLLLVATAMLGVPTTFAKKKGRAGDVIVVLAKKANFRIYDGDTVYYAFDEDDGVYNEDGEPYKGTLRLLGYDTPEKFMPPLGMYYDQPYGQEASWFLQRLMRNARRIYIYTRFEKGMRNRVLAHITIDGKLLAAEMIRWGLAYETVTAFGDGGFPEFAIDIMDAWQASPIHHSFTQKTVPRFIDPYIWRKMNLHIEHKLTWDEWGALSSAQKRETVYQARELADVKRKEVILANPKYRDRLRYPLPQPF